MTDRYTRNKIRRERNRRAAEEASLRETFAWETLQSHCYQIQHFLDNMIIPLNMLVQCNLTPWVDKADYQSLSVVAQTMRNDYVKYHELLMSLYTPMVGKSGEFGFTLESIHAFQQLLEKITGLNLEIHSVMQPNMVYLANAVDKAAQNRFTVGVQRGVYKHIGDNMFIDGEPDPAFPPMRECWPSVVRAGTTEAPEAMRAIVPAIPEEAAVPTPY